MDDLRLLRVLREVALRGSFSAAAEALSFSQPAVSQQIARLERQVGVKLIEREPKGLRLTLAGEALVRHTEKILAQLAEAETELGEIADQARGRIRLAAFATASGTIVPTAVSAFRRARPAVEVQLTLADPPDSVPALRRGEYDIALSEEQGFGDDVDTSSLHVEHLLDDPLYAALPAGHPLATKRALALSDLADEDWMLVSLSGNCADSNIVLRACAEAGFEPRVAFTSEDYFAIQGLVASGMGIALVPGLGLASQHEEVAVRPLRGKPPRRRIVAVTAQDPGGAVAMMIECLREASTAFSATAPRALAAA